MAARRTDWNRLLAVVLLGVIISVCTAREADITIILQVGENETITSPNYPNNYGDYTDILWSIEAPAGHRLGVVFTAFDLEKGYDYLTIYEQIQDTNFDENNANETARLTGYVHPNPVISEGRGMWIRFTSDNVYTYAGFSLDVYVLSGDGVWDCDFDNGDCNVTHEEGSWLIAEDNAYDSKFYAADLNEGDASDVASFTLPTQDISKTGFISFTYYSWTDFRISHDHDDTEGSLSVDICGSNIFLVNSRSFYYYYHSSPIYFICSGADEVEITFTATRGSRTTYIFVDDIHVIGIPDPPEQTTQLVPTTPLLGVTTTGVIITTSLPKTTSAETTVVTSMSQTTTAGATTTVRSSEVTTGRSTSQAMTGSDSATMAMSTFMTSDSTKGTTTSLYVNVAPMTGNRGAVVVPVVASLLSVIIIAVLVLVLLFLVRKRRRNAAPPLDPSKTEEDDPNLFDNPAYCSKDILDTPDIIMGVHVPPSTSPAGAAVLPPDKEGQMRLVQDVSSSECETALDTEANHAYYSLDDPQTEYNYIGIASPRTEDDAHIYQDASASDSMATTKPSANPESSGPVTSAGSANPYQELRRPHAANDGENNPAYHTLEDPSVSSHESCKPSVYLELTPAGGNATLYDEEEYNTLNKSPLGGQTRQVPPRNPKKVPGSSTVDGVEGGYSALARLENDSATTEKPGDFLSDNQYNTLGESESVPEEKKEAPNAYSELDLSGRNGDQDYASCDEPAGDITSGKLGQTNCSAGYEPLRIVDNTYQSVDEPEYHSYQDPTDMGKKGNTATPVDPQALYDSQYNVLHSGKEMGNYHLYQAAKDLPPTDDAVYEEFQSEKLSPVDEYSTINQDPKTRSNQADPANQHEPIYSDEVYGGF